LLLNPHLFCVKKSPPLLSDGDFVLPFIRKDQPINSLKLSAVPPGDSIIGM
jgi:hypothetical protein